MEKIVFYLADSPWFICIIFQLFCSQKTPVRKYLYIATPKIITNLALTNAHIYTSHVLDVMMFDYSSTYGTIL